MTDPVPLLLLLPARRGDRIRSLCAYLRRVRDGALWRQTGAPSFEVWALRAFGLHPPLLAKLLGIADGPIGGAGRRPGRKPAGQRKEPAR